MGGKIAEVFDSVQGEGIYLGERQLFVRFYGCNLHCKYCDTRMDSFLEYEPEELFLELQLYPKGYHSVSFTGGEPLMQYDFLKSVMKLNHMAGLVNYLETNGTLPDAFGEVSDFVDIVSMDIKLPSSTGQQDFWKEHKRFLSLADKKDVFLKAVICENTLETDMVKAIDLLKSANRSHTLVLQPDSSVAAGRLDEKMEKFKAICTASGIISCVIPQVHKNAGIK